MTKVTVEILDSTRNAIVDNKQEMGKIIAIATYADRQQVCFLKQGEKVGLWIPVSALVGFPDTSNATKKAEEE